MFREDAVTPVTHAANGLDTASPMWWWGIRGFDTVTEIKMEALPKPPANLVPLFPVRMAWKTRKRVFRQGNRELVGY